jgi:hypothetical protein
VERPILIESRAARPFTPRVQNGQRREWTSIDPRSRHRPRAGRLAAAAPHRDGLVGGCQRRPTSRTCRSASSPGRSRDHRQPRHEEKIRTLAITQPDAYVVLDYAEQDIQITGGRRRIYTLNPRDRSATGALLRSSTSRGTKQPAQARDPSLVRGVRRARAGEARGPGETRGPPVRWHGPRDRANDRTAAARRLLEPPYRGALTRLICGTGVLPARVAARPGARDGAWFAFTFGEGPA